ncbi:MAG: hypothetical protein COB84_01005 [Rhodobacteraceae bacterium]|nr:MAG: hypothetical protein COB84_01005 [Paracoccaceae bacterium]
MEIRIYAGAHRTATQHFASALDVNGKALAAEGVMYTPANRRTLNSMADAISAIGEGADEVDVREELMTRLVPNGDMKRLLIVSPHLLGKASRPFGPEQLYPRARGLVEQFEKLFVGHDLRYFLSVRNPATFLTSCYAQNILYGRFSRFREYLDDANYNSYRWSSFLHRIQGKEARIPISVWRYEDYRYIWRDIMGAFTGVSSAQDFSDVAPNLGQSLTLEGAHLFEKFAGENPEQIKTDFEALKDVFQRKFPSSPNQITGPDWSPDTVRDLTYNYEDDWYYIERMDNVQTIQPRNFEFDKDKTNLA